MSVLYKKYSLEHAVHTISFPTFVSLLLMVQLFSRSFPHPSCSSQSEAGSLLIYSRGALKMVECSLTAWFQVLRLKIRINAYLIFIGLLYVKSDTVHHNTIRMSKTKLRYSILSLLTASNNLKMSLNAAPKYGLLV